MECRLVNIQKQMSQHRLSPISSENRMHPIVSTPGEHEVTQSWAIPISGTFPSCPLWSVAKSLTRLLGGRQGMGSAEGPG
jgi:hypothetical protein